LLLTAALRTPAIIQHQSSATIFGAIDPQTRDSLRLQQCLLIDGCSC